MELRSLLFVLLAVAAAQGASANFCAPAPELQIQFGNAARQTILGPDAFDRNLAPYLALRKQYPGDLFVHERYQEAVQQFGIEGQLRDLTQEYQELAAEHSGEAIYTYLAARSLIGRGTPAAISALSDLLSEHPEFAPAHRMLAEIYEVDAFRDPEKAAGERAKFLSLCPGAALAHLPPTLPEPSLLVGQAELQLEKGGDPKQMGAMALQGIRADEWRLQRVRPFDWYSVDFKRRVQQELQSEYWKYWTIEVLCERKEGHPEQARTLLATMEDRAGRLGSRSPQAYWDAETALARVYIDGKQTREAQQKVSTLERFLRDHPDQTWQAEFAELQRMAKEL